MSTSLETSLRALLSNKDFVTVRVTVRQASLAGAALAFAGGLFVGTALRPAAADVLVSYRIGRDARAALKPWVEEAKLWPMTYETAEPGRIVDWCVDHPTNGYSFLAGKPSQPILWEGEFLAPQTAGRCRRMLARVVAREPQGLRLRFLGLP
jgi:hypothetical protein